MSSTLSEIVAENSIEIRFFGKYAMISFSSSRNPKLRRRSASSRTRVCSPSNSVGKRNVRSKCSRSRPGVPTTRRGFFLRIMM